MRFPTTKQAQATANRKHSSILSKIERYFSPVWGISTFARSSHCIMRAERSVRVFQRPYKPRQTQTAIVRRFCRKLCVISLPFQIFSRLNALFSPFYMQNVVHAFSAASKQAQTHANCHHSSILTKINRYFSPVCDISTFKSTFYSILHAERNACLYWCLEASPDTLKSQ